MEKFQIFFKSNQNKDYTLSISRIDELTNTYKLKVIYETFDGDTMKYEKTKIKEFHIGAKEIIDKIEEIDFSKKYNFEKNSNSYYQISLGDKKINVSDKKEILDILDSFNFIEITNITPNECKYIQDIYEYLKLKNLFMKKCAKYSEADILKINERFSTENPYDIFENISYL